MKRQYGKITQHLAALMLGVLLTLGSVAQAADNIAIGDVAGVGPDLGDSNTFTLNAFVSQLQKRAFLTVGNTALTTGDTLPAGTSVDFLIYLNNEGDLSIDDVGIQETLLGFTYVPNSLHVLNTTAACVGGCGAPQELIIYNNARVAGVKTDAINDDEASFAGTTVEVGNTITVGNTQQDAAANLVLALVFTATID
jgi:hypothetical protein